MKATLKDGKEIEVEETDVIKAIKEEYEKKIEEEKKKVEDTTKKAEEEKKAMREEHVKQMRALLTGRKEHKEKEEFEEFEEDEEEEVIKQAKEIFKKIM